MRQRENAGAVAASGYVKLLQTALRPPAQNGSATKPLLQEARWFLP
jgi:hypothetical protein